MSSTPILDNKDPSAPSVFEPTALLREARRQKDLPIVGVPALCVLDPDGDIVRRLRHSGQAKPSATWPCYHTELYEFALAGKTAGIIGCAVGAPFAVLVAEELFACGCRILISLTSARQIVPAGELPYFVVIDRALHDEGTSYHYAPPHIFAEADSRIVAAAVRGRRWESSWYGANPLTGSRIRPILGCRVMGATIKIAETELPRCVTLPILIKLK